MNKFYFILVFYQLAIMSFTYGAERNCTGPTAYYKALRCEPVFYKEDDECPYKYNCDHLKSRSSQKCYVNGNEYEIGTQLNEKDANPCDIRCICRMGSDGFAGFLCDEVYCFTPSPKPGCYRRKSPLKCCAGEEVCPEKPEDRATCVVNGKTYKDGEYFYIESEPEETCVCQPGYKGQNVEPFCANPKRPYCDPQFRGGYFVANNCAPVYYSNQSPQTDCNRSTRCQSDRDEVIKHSENNGKVIGDEMLCRFGNLTMHAGDKLNQSTDYRFTCMECVCEFGPVLTCQRFPDEQCDEF